MDGIEVVSQDGEDEDGDEDDEAGHCKAVASQPPEGIRPEPTLASGIASCGILKGRNRNRSRHCPPTGT